MPRIGRLILALGCACCVAGVAGRSLAAEPEYNPIRKYPVAIGPEATRLIVGFQATPSNAVIKTVTFQRRARSYRITQAQTSPADVTALAQRVGLSLAKSRQFTPSMHVLFLPKTLYGADVEAALAKLRADPAVKFAAVDQRRYPATVPNDPLFMPTPGTASGQWYMNTPSSTLVTLEGGVQTMDLSATDSVSAWNITTGSPGIVIADVDTGILFDHPDLLRAGLGGRLLPGYDFVGEDLDPNTGAALGTFLIANDGDGWDPDPSDPGDWISNSDPQNSLFAGDTPAPSSWHGTRVVGVFGAITNNNVGIAGMTWGSASAPGPWVLPVRALGKGGGYDSDIIAGIEWAVGFTVTNPDGSAVPDNPYLADIINLSLGGSKDSCSGSAYETPLKDVTSAGVLVVISAGNGGNPGVLAPVELPGNCASVVPGVMAVAGLRNVGTKVGYSSFGPEVSVSAPAGNCINTGGACLRSIDTTTDLGTTVPLAGSNYTYTNETNPNLGTSFAAPIVSGIAALMRSVNNNLQPAQLAARMKASATAFPAGAAGVPTCPNNGPSNGSGECACPNDGSECGAGMVDALHAVQAAQKPIGVIVIPANFGAGSVFDASGSVAACNTSAAPPVPLSIVSYAWTASPASIIVTGANTDKVTVSPAAGTLTLTVKDSVGNVDVETVTFHTATSATSTAPTKAGTSATACPKALQVTPIPPTVAQAFSPSTVGPTIASTLTFTLNNANGYALTQSNFSDTLPTGVTISSSPAPTTTCTGANGTLSTTPSAVTLSDANIPVNGSCTVTVSVSSTAAGAYINTVPANALMTGPAGGNAATTSSTLTVTTPNRPAVAEAFSPASVGQNGNSTLTITLSNSNAYPLTAVGLTNELPSGVAAKSSPAATNTCGGTMPAPTSSVTLSGATIPASSACTVTLTVSSGTVGSYMDTIGAGAVTTAAAGSNTAAATATLTVTASSGGGGGALDWLDVLFAAGVLLAGRGQASRRWLVRESRRRPRR